MKIGDVPPTDCTPIPAYHPTFILALKVCVNFVSFLSITGASLIIGTFIAFKSLRTRARQILVQLSIADFAVAASHLLGVSINLPKYSHHICKEIPLSDVNFTTDVFCKIQGGTTIFFTVASFFWTIAVALYLLTVIVFESQRAGKWMTLMFYPVCWGIPTVLVIVFAVTQSFGFHANVDTGWCYLRHFRYMRSNSNTTDDSITIPEVFSQVFVYLTYLTLLVLYLWIRCSIRCKIRSASSKISIAYKLRLKAKNADVKLTFIPLIFILLRMWGTALGIAYIYLPQKKLVHFRTTNLNAALVFLAAIGSSSQGLTNALLFCVFTSVVRQKLLKLVKNCLCCYCCKREGPHTYLLEPSASGSRATRENTTLYEDEDDVWKEDLQSAAGCRSNPKPAARIFSDSLEGSKYHSVSVGKRAACGNE